MPTFGHIVYGFCLLLPILYYSRNKFSYKVSFIFLANNLFGPDIVNFFFVIPTHSIIGFSILAIPYSLIFTYGSRFSLIRSEGKFPLKLEDSGIREVNWKNAYCATASGGISHFFIDQFYHFHQKMEIFEGISISHDEMLAWGGEAYHVLSPLMVIGFLIVVFTILLSLYFFKEGYKETFKLFLISTVLSFIFFAISTEVYGGEREWGVLVHSIVYVLIPLFLLMYAARDVEENPRITPDEPKINRRTLLNIVAVISIVVAIFFLLYASLAIFLSDTVAKIYGNTSPETVFAIEMFGVFFGTIATFLLIGGIGLFFKINICRYFAIAAASLFLIFGFPLAIAFFLCERDVKALFKKEVKE